MISVPPLEPPVINVIPVPTPANNPPITQVAKTSFPNIGSLGILIIDKKIDIDVTLNTVFLKKVFPKDLYAKIKTGTFKT